MGLFGSDFGAEGLPPLGDDDRRDGQDGDAWLEAWQGDDAWKPADRWVDEVLRGASWLRRLTGSAGGGGKHVPSGLCHTSGCVYPTATGELFCGHCTLQRYLVEIWEGHAAVEALPTRALTEHDLAAIPPMPPVALPEPETPDTPPPPLPDWVGWVNPDCQWCRHIMREFGQRPPILTAAQFAARLAADPTFAHYVCWRHKRPQRAG